MKLLVIDDNFSKLSELIQNIDWGEATEVTVLHHPDRELFQAELDLADLCLTPANTPVDCGYVLVFLGKGEKSRTSAFFSSSMREEQLREALASAVRSSIPHPEQPGEIIVNKVKSYVMDHISESIDRDNLSRALFMNSDYLNRAVKKETGKTLVQYVQYLRIQKARELLDQSKGQRIAEIGEECGFSDAAYFSRVFHHWCGMSPSEYSTRNSQLH